MSTFRRPVFLRKTLESIAQQTYKDFEVIISDNDPEKSAEPVVKGMGDSRFRYFSNGTNLGMVPSFNKSIERSTAEFVVMITDDDPVYPNMLSTLMDLRNEFPGYYFYMGGCDWFCESHELGKLYNFKVGTNSCLSNQFDIDHKIAFTPTQFLKQLFRFGIFPHYLWSTCMVKRASLLKMGGVPDYGTPFLGDYAFIGVMAIESGCVVINRSLGCQTLHDANFGRRQHEQIAIAAEKFPTYLEEKASVLSSWPEIRGLMQRFVGLWVISHLSFLHEYYKKKAEPARELRKAEKEVFRIGIMRRFRFKYYLKKRFPLFHNWLVKMKKNFNRGGF